MSGSSLKQEVLGFNMAQGHRGGASGTELTCQCRLDIRDTGSIPGLGRSPGGGNGNPLQYCCLGNPMNRSLVGSCPWDYLESDTTEAT